MADKMNASTAQGIARRRIGHTRESLARDAKYLADDTARYAASLANGDPDSGMANRIAQSALQLAQLAATLNGMTEASAYLDAVVDDGPKDA